MMRKLRVFGLPSLIVAVLWFAGWTDSTARRPAVTRTETPVVDGTVGPRHRLADDQLTIARLGEIDFEQQTEEQAS